jgi:hypothetical protein
MTTAYTRRLASTPFDDFERGYLEGLTQAGLIVRSQVQRRKWDITEFWKQRIENNRSSESDGGPSTLIIDVLMELYAISKASEKWWMDYFEREHGDFFDRPVRPSLRLVVDRPDGDDAP